LLVEQELGGGRFQNQNDWERSESFANKSFGDCSSSGFVAAVDAPLWVILYWQGLFSQLQLKKQIELGQIIQGDYEACSPT